MVWSPGTPWPGCSTSCWSGTRTDPGGGSDGIYSAPHPGPAGGGLRVANQVDVNVGAVCGGPMG